MGLILGIDTGEHTGWAKANNGIIVDCGLVWVQKDKPLGVLPEVQLAQVVIEKPVYRPEKDVDPNDMITLGIKVGRFVETYLVLGNQVTTVRPNDWKGGSVPKDIQNRRDEAALTPNEQLTVHHRLVNIAPSYHNNVWDAIGIVLWKCRKVGLRK